MTMNIIRKQLITVLALAAAASLTACSSVSNAPSEVAVKVNDGVLFPVEKTILDCVQPSKNDMGSPGPDYFKYPAGERTYKFSTDKDADGGPVSIVKGNIPLTITGVVTFRLNTDCNTLKEFHALIGSKSWNGHFAYINDGYEGWDTMLETYIEQAIQSSATAAVSQITADYMAIYNGEGRTELEKAMATLLPQYVESLSGGKFFTGFRIVVNKPTIDRPDILDAIASKTVAQLQNEAQQQRNTAVATELESIKQVVNVIGKDGYVAYLNAQLTKQQLSLLSEAIKTGKITLLPIPYGTNTSVPLTPGN